MKYGLRAGACPSGFTCGVRSAINGALATRFAWWRAILIAGIIGLVFLHFLALPHDKMIHWEWMVPLLWLVGPLLMIERLLRRCRAEALPPAETFRPIAGILVLFGFVLLFLFSSTVKYKWFFFLDWAPPDDAGLWTVNSGIGYFIFLTTLCLPLFLFPSHRLRWLLAGALILVQAAALFLLLNTTAGLPLYNDDHPSFLYRLWVFGQCFPRLINYNPVWNAGNLELAGIATGANAPGILFWPLWKYGSVVQYYTCALGILYIILVPCLAIASMRIMGFGRTPAWVAGFLALGISRYHFLWLLNYGTMGANFTSAFIMPASACLYRIIVLNRMEKATGVGLVVSLVFLGMWPPGMVMMLSLLLAFLLQARQWSKQKILFLICCGAAALMALFYPLMIMLRATDVISHDWMRPRESMGGLVQAIAAGWNHLWDHAREAHPLLLFLGIGGLLVTPDKTLRNWFLPILAVLALLAGWGPAWIPDIQPSRMAIPLFFVAVLPTAALMGRILTAQHIRLAVLRSAAFCLLVMSGWNCAKLYAGEGEGGYELMPPVIRELASWVKHHTARGDRIMLAGGTGHLYEGGHVTAFPVLFDREVLSSEYRHDQVKDIRYGCPPEEPPAEPSALDTYLDLFAVRYVMTVWEDWKRLLRSDPGRFLEVGVIYGQDSTNSLFKVCHPSSVFLKGAGTVRARLNALDVTLDNPVGEAVIKYNWIEGLSAPEAEIYPFDAGQGVRLIGIRSHGAKRVHIRFRRWL